MNKKILDVIIGIIAIIAVAAAVSTLPSSEITHKTNKKIGLLINSANQSITSQELDQIYFKASSTGIGRSMLV
jgi:nitrate reductase NapAB chaperone NapD